MTRGQIQDMIQKFATENPQYRDALIADPKAVVEKQLNTSLPGDVTVKAVVESAETTYVIVPHVPGDGELSDTDLERVAGGLGDKEANCDEAPGVANTMTIINL